MSPTPLVPKIYHIVHYDRLASIIEKGCLFSDKLAQDSKLPGTNIGMSRIKERRLNNALKSHPELHVGECVPFYFCPRSVMLYIIYCRNHSDLSYREGQDNIVHLESELYNAIQWADGQSLKWAFTLANAAAKYSEDRANIEALEDINWDAVNAINWSGPGIDSAIKEGKQAEFLVENKFPLKLISSIGVVNSKFANKVQQIFKTANHKPSITIRSDWYY